MFFFLFFRNSIWFNPSKKPQSIKMSKKNKQFMKWACLNKITLYKIRKSINTKIKVAVRCAVVYIFVISNSCLWLSLLIGLLMKEWIKWKQLINTLFVLFQTFNFEIFLLSPSQIQHKSTDNWTTKQNWTLRLVIALMINVFPTSGTPQKFARAFSAEVT